VFQQFFLDGVAVEPGDCAQPACDRCACPAARFHVAAEAFDVCPSRLEQVQAVLLAPSGEHPQVERVSVAGQTAVARQEASQRDPLSFGEQRLDRHDDVGRRDSGGHRDLRDLGRSLASSERRRPGRWMKHPG